MQLCYNTYRSNATQFRSEFFGEFGFANLLGLVSGAPHNHVICLVGASDVHIVDSFEDIRTNFSTAFNVFDSVDLMTRVSAK